MRFVILIFFIKAYVVGTHLNCIDSLCLYIEVDKKYTGFYLKTEIALLCTYRGLWGNKVEYGNTCWVIWGTA